jgi:glycosyltransferase involved in cell wall biosynthesis
MADIKLSIFGSSAFGKSRFGMFSGKRSKQSQQRLFDRDFYVQNYAAGQGEGFDAWQHFCDVGHRENFNPHPLFETAFYRDRYLRGQMDVNPLLHYIENSSDYLNPHPLLDIRFYVGQLDQRKNKSKPADQTWLEYFLENNLNDLKSASQEFSSRRYIDRYPEIMRDGINPLYHFVTFRGEKESFEISDLASWSPLFDTSYYLDMNVDIAEAGLDPWKHFCDHGFRENRNPHPIFDTAYYRAKYLSAEPDTNPLQHYHAKGYQLLSTHPLFDAAFYVFQTGTSFEPGGITPLEHFMNYNRENLASPSPLFCTARYIETYTDIADCNLVPLYHFLRHGVGSRKFLVDQNHLDQLEFQSNEAIEFATRHGLRHTDFIRSTSQLGDKPAVVCVSHEGSMTGAPLIILKIAETIRSKYGLEVINVIFRPGELNEKFELLGPTMDLDGKCLARNSHSFYEDMDLLCETLGGKSVVGAIVNSAESREILPTLRKLEIPTVSLVHENARCYDPGTFDTIAELSDRIVFPSDYVQQSAFENAEFASQSTEVLPQGLLNESLLELDPSDPQNGIRDQLGIPSDATFVLSCGTLDGRKGVDLFLSTAIVALSRAKPGSVYFGWLGGNSFRQLLDQRYWLEKDIETAGLSEYVKLMGTTDNVAPYMQACDMLFLPSRIDPFPCVVNEAMAIGKPVVLFEGGSGCVPMIGDAGGAVVPYGNVADAAQAIMDLAKYPTLRKEMGVRNRQYVEEHLDFGVYVKKLMDCLLSAADLSQRETPRIVLDTLRRAKGGEDRKRVIFSLPSWRISGVNAFVENLVGKLCENGYDASILFTTRDPSEVGRTQQMPRVPYRFLTARTLLAEERQERMRNYLEQYAPCVFVPNYDYEVSAITPDLPIDVGVLGALHSDEDEHYLHGYQMGHYWDAIVAVSETIKSKFLDLNPAFAAKTEMIRYGVHVSDTQPVKRREPDQIRLIYTGRIIQAQKRIFDFIELIEKLDSRSVPFTFTFVGSGPDEVDFQSRLKPWVEKGKARYLGSCSSDVVRQELEKHDALVLMSEFEGLPLSLLEGMAEGCVPVVTAIESGISEILKHHQNGMLAPVGDIDAMANDILALHRDRELLDRMSQAAFQTLDEKRLTVKHMVDSYGEVLESVFEKISSPQMPVTIPLQSDFVRSCLRAA